MKFRFLPIFLVAATIQAADPPAEDLGTVSPRRGITLEQSSPDFLNFKIDFFPSFPPTNQVSIVKTNNLLVVDDLKALPSGRILMGVQVVCQDGSESDVAFYIFNLRRARPAAPRATATGLPSSEGERSATNAIRRIRERRSMETTPPPALPGMDEVGGVPAAELWPTNKVPRTLTGGKNETYAEGQDRRMLEYYNRPGRRNER